WQAFGGNVTQARGWVNVVPKDSLRRRVYIAPFGLYVTLDAGTFESVAINPMTKTVRLTLSPAMPFVTHALLRRELVARVPGITRFAVTQAPEGVSTRGAIQVTLELTPIVVELQAY